MCFHGAVTAHAQASTARAEAKSVEIASLTGIRGFAALMVMLIHLSGSLTGYHWLGMHGYGPIALFTLSGFLLHRPFGRWALGLGGRPDLWVYSVRRVLRIYPAYLVCLHVWYLVWENATPHSFMDWVKDVTMINTLQFWNLVDGLRQTWSMGTELTWYVILPFFAVAVHWVVSKVPERHKLSTHLWLLASSLPISCAYVVWVDVASPFDSASMWFPKFFVCFAGGAAISLLIDAERAGMTQLSRLHRLASGQVLVVVAAALIAINMSDLSGPKSFVAITPWQTAARDLTSWGLIMVMLLLAIMAPATHWVVRCLSTRFMQATGRWSYGIYLWHLPVIVLVGDEGQRGEGVLGVLWIIVLVSVPSYLLGAASWAWVEAPAMNWSKALTTSSGGARAARGVREQKVEPWTGEPALPPTVQPPAPEPPQGPGRHR